MWFPAISTTWHYALFPLCGSQKDTTLHCKICHETVRGKELSLLVPTDSKTHTARQWNRWRGINVSQFHWFCDRCQSKCCRWQFWWRQNTELTCFIMLPHYLQRRTPASFDKWTSHLHNSFIWIQINNSLSKPKENNDPNGGLQYFQYSRGPFLLLGKKLPLNWIWKSAWLKKKKSLLSKWVNIVFWYLKSAGRGEVFNPDWKLYCQQNNSIVMPRLVICFNCPNNSYYIHFN